MMVARWKFTAVFGRKQEAIDLIKQWNEQIGSQTNLNVSKERILSCSVGVSEGLVESELEIANLNELDKFFEKINSIQMHKDWGL